MTTNQTALPMERSFIYRDLADDKSEDASGGSMSLHDFSLQKRTGIRGADAVAVLENLGMPVPNSPNQSGTGNLGELVLRLSAKELWVLDLAGDGESATEKVDQAELSGKQCYSLFCQHSHTWFVMTGDFLAETFAKVCGVDLREKAFQKGSIAQTSVARVNAIIVAHELAGKPAFSILSDSASASYLWGALHDAMGEFNA